MTADALPPLPVPPGRPSDAVRILHMTDEELRRAAFLHAELHAVDMSYCKHEPGKERCSTLQLAEILSQQLTKFKPEKNPFERLSAWIFYLLLWVTATVALVPPSLFIARVWWKWWLP